MNSNVTQSDKRRDSKQSLERLRWKALIACAVAISFVWAIPQSQAPPPTPPSIQRQVRILLCGEPTTEHGLQAMSEVTPLLLEMPIGDGMIGVLGTGWGGYVIQPGFVLDLSATKVRLLFGIPDAASLHEYLLNNVAGSLPTVPRKGILRYRAILFRHNQDFGAVIMWPTGAALDPATPETQRQLAARWDALAEEIAKNGNRRI